MSPGDSDSAMLPETIQIRAFDPTNAAAISALTREVFDEHVSPTFEPEGIAEMHRHLAPEAIAERAKTHETLVAWQGTMPVGVVEVRESRHISMLFVRTSHMGLGIATELMARAIESCQSAGCPALTVNSSLNAQGFYKQLGFRPQGEPQKTHGFAFQPMEKKLISI
jgi:predicted N-acetyltransferase YhbS